MKFYLGTHRENWLEKMDIPLFVSHRRLMNRKRLPRARAGWALDSGGFTELTMHGRWVTTESEYVEAVNRYQEEIGQLEWAAPMDWMCEPHMLKNTGLTVEDHQELTVENYLRLRDRGPFIPVLQGWEAGDYARCAGLYSQAGVDLEAEPIIGLGSVCRRQNTSQLGRVIYELDGLNLHGFGIKMVGLAAYGHLLASADSMAWSYNARRNPAIPGHRHKSCANCPDWAMRWRKRLMAVLEDSHRRSLQMELGASPV